MRGSFPQAPLMPLRFVRFIFALFILFVAGRASAVVLTPDLDALIAQHADEPQRFALAYAHTADSDRDGAWAEVEGEAVWRYELAVPTALGLGVHAPHARFPAGTRAVAIGADRQPQPLEIVGGEIWSPIVAGDRLLLEARMPAAARPQFELLLDEVQIAYRGTGDATHPAYAKAAGVQPKSACSINWQCVRNAGNEQAGRATVVITVQNQIVCSATLVGNTAGDLRPLLLTARHCQASGDTGSGVKVYYKGEAACGAALNYAYHHGIESSGASHIGARGDGWLLQVNTPPAAASAWWAGWDATDAAPIGVVQEVHHQDGRDKQYVSSATPPTKENFSIDGGSTVIPGWTWVVATGDAGSGASGAGTFVGNRLIGVHSGGNGECAGSENSSQRLADLFQSAAIRQALDPTGSGTRVVDGRNTASGLPTVDLNVSLGNILVGSLLRLTWTSQNVTSCTASGAWSGTKPVSGSEELGVNLLGLLTYRLNCSGPNGSAEDVASVNAHDAGNPPASPQPPASGGSGGGGGGSMNLLGLLALLLVRYLRS